MHFYVTRRAFVRNYMRHSQPPKCLSKLHSDYGIWAVAQPAVHQNKKERQFVINLIPLQAHRCMPRILTLRHFVACCRSLYALHSSFSVVDQYMLRINLFDRLYSLMQISVCLVFLLCGSLWPAVDLFTPCIVLSLWQLVFCHCVVDQGALRVTVSRKMWRLLLIHWSNSFCKRFQVRHTSQQLATFCICYLAIWRHEHVRQYGFYRLVNGTWPAMDKTNVGLEVESGPGVMGPWRAIPWQCRTYRT